MHSENDKVQVGTKYCEICECVPNFILVSSDEASAWNWDLALHMHVLLCSCACQYMCACPHIRYTYGAPGCGLFMSMKRWHIWWAFMKLHWNCFVERTLWVERKNYACSGGVCINPSYWLWNFHEHYFLRLSCVPMNHNRCPVTHGCIKCSHFVDFVMAQLAEASIFKGENLRFDTSCNVFFRLLHYDLCLFLNET